jgi:hypothetical protein
MELLGIFTKSWAVENWNLSSVSLLCSLFLKITQREFDNYYVRFLNLRHTDTLFVCVSSPRLNNYSFSSYHVKVYM